MKRRKLEKTGKWTCELRVAVPQLRCGDLSMETLKGILLCGASDEHRVWLGKWFARLEEKNAGSGGVRSSRLGRSL